MPNVLKSQSLPPFIISVIFFSKHSTYKSGHFLLFNLDFFVLVFETESHWFMETKFIQRTEKNVFN